MTNNAYAKNNGDGLLCSILCRNHRYFFRPDDYNHIMLHGLNPAE
jgi:hypothetical protein